MSNAVPLIAGAMLGVAEFAFAVLQRGGEPAPGLLTRIAGAAAVGLGGVLVSALVLLAATPNVGRSLPLTIVGTLAGLGAIGLLSRPWRRRS
jgi:hypothetical protein